MREMNENDKYNINHIIWTVEMKSSKGWSSVALILWLLNECHNIKLHNYNLLFVLDAIQAGVGNFEIFKEIGGSLKTQGHIPGVKVLITESKAPLLQLCNTGD